jgi:hypothetical protein
MYTGPQPSAQRFRELVATYLSSKTDVEEVKEEYLQVCFTRFSNRLLFCDTHNVAGQIYEAAKRVPKTSTVAQAKAVHNLVISGDFNDVHGRASLVMAYENGHKPVLLKIPDKPGDAEHEHRICQTLEIPPGCNLV